MISEINIYVYAEYSRYEILRKKKNISNMHDNKIYF